jgi:hypothetical protein
MPIVLRQGTMRRPRTREDPTEAAARRLLPRAPTAALRPPTRRSVITAGITSALLRPSRVFAAARPHYDVIIYGGTASGVIAAVAGYRGAARIALVLGLSPLGGMVASGLSRTDGSIPYIKGIALEFFARVGAHYGLQYELNFEPHVA